MLCPPHQLCAVVAAAAKGLTTLCTSTATPRNLAAAPLRDRLLAASLAVGTLKLLLLLLPRSPASDRGGTAERGALDGCSGSAAPLTSVLTALGGAASEGQLTRLAVVPEGWPPETPEGFSSAGGRGGISRTMDPDAPGLGLPSAARSTCMGSEQPSRSGLAVPGRMLGDPGTFQIIEMQAQGG